MPKSVTLSLYFFAAFVQAGTYGLTFLLPKLFASFGADEKDVGAMLIVTTIATLLSVYYSGHLADKFGRVVTLGLAGYSIAIGLLAFGWAQSVGLPLVLASIFLGVGWGLFYTLTPVVLTRITAQDERVRYFALLSVFIMAGFGLSPVMASEMENAGFSVSHAFYAMAGLCVFSGTLFLLLAPPIRSLSNKAGTEPRSGLTLASVGRIFTSRARLPVIMVFIGASVFAGMNNFQTVFADAQSLRYSDYFLTYTITVIVCRILLVGFKGGTAPYATISGLQFIMCASVVLFMFVNGNQLTYIMTAVLFGIGYGASYPVLVAMAANDAKSDLVPQTLQLFALTYFIGIFGFPLIAGWMIVEFGTFSLLVFVAILAAIEATMAGMRFLSNKKIAAQALARS